MYTIPWLGEVEIDAIVATTTVHNVIYPLLPRVVSCPPRNYYYYLLSDKHLM